VPYSGGHSDPNTFLGALFWRTLRPKHLPRCPILEDTQTQTPSSVPYSGGHSDPKTFLGALFWRTLRPKNLPRCPILEGTQTQTPSSVPYSGGHSDPKTFLGALFWRTLRPKHLPRCPILEGTQTQKPSSVPYSGGHSDPKTFLGALFWRTLRPKNFPRCPILEATQTQKPSSVPYSGGPSAYVRPLIWQTKFHTHIKQKANYISLYFKFLGPTLEDKRFQTARRQALPALHLRSFSNSPRFANTTDCQLTRPTVSVSTLGSGKTRGVGWYTVTGLRVPPDVGTGTGTRVCRNVGSYAVDCLLYKSPCSPVQKDQLFTALTWIVGSSKTSVRPNQTARRHGRCPSPLRNGRSVL